MNQKIGIKLGCRRLVILAAWLLVAGWLITACAGPGDAQAAPTTAATRSGSLTPFSPSPPALTRTPSPAPAALNTATPLPSPTLTPRSHTVVKDEDMFGIALRYGITLEELKTANPETDPRFLSIGAVLTVPHSLTPQPEDPEAESPVEPTPMPVELGVLSCYRTGEGGAWCFQPARNPNATPLEAVEAVFRVQEDQSTNVLEQAASLPLDILPPGDALPLTAYFEAGHFLSPDSNLQSSSELLSALPGSPDGRYLAVEVTDIQVLLSEDGHSAIINASITLSEPGTPASRVWAAAVAYSASGEIAGVRRWESSSGEVLDSHSPLPVVFSIFSAGPQIERVAVFAEARP